MDTPISMSSPGTRLIQLAECFLTRAGTCTEPAPRAEQIELVLHGRSRPDVFLCRITGDSRRTGCKHSDACTSVLTFHDGLERAYCLLDLVLVGCAVTEN